MVVVCCCIVSLTRLLVVFALGVCPHSSYFIGSRGICVSACVYQCVPGSSGICVSTCVCCIDELYADACDSCVSLLLLCRLVLIGASRLKPLESKRVDIYVWSTAFQTYFKVL